jgi:hypothetical protein
MITLYEKKNMHVCVHLMCKPDKIYYNKNLQIYSLHFLAYRIREAKIEQFGEKMFL